MITAALSALVIFLSVVVQVKEAALQVHVPVEKEVAYASDWCWPTDTLNESSCFPRCPPEQPQSFASTSTLNGLVQSSRVQDCNAYNYVTEARIYPQDLNVAVLTKRGWVDVNNDNDNENTTTSRAGVTLLNISNPSQPTVISVWDSPNNDAVEGQDRINDLLVVCSIDQGGIYTFNMSKQNSSSLELLAYTDIPDAGSTLHVKLKQYKGSSSRTVAFLSQGWCYDVQLMGCDRFGWTKVHIVDVTNATHPTVLGSISTSVLQPESLQVRGNYLYVGGIGSDVLAVLNITNPDAVQVMCAGGICSSHPHYNQMVGEVLHNGVDGSFHPVQEDDDNLLHRYWLAALWGTPGGVAVFDTLDPALPVPVHHVTDKTLSSANRVHVHNHYAIIPIEQDPAGGFAVLNVANTSCPPTVEGIHFLGVGQRPTTLTTNGNRDAPPVSSRVYCLVAKDDHVILFVSWTCEMYSFEVPMIASKAPVLDCPPPPENEASRPPATTDLTSTEVSTTAVAKPVKLAMRLFASRWIAFVGLLLLLVSTMIVNSRIPLGLLLW